MKKNIKSNEMSSNELTQKLIEDRIKREKSFSDKFQALKKEYNCEVRPVFTIKMDGIHPALEIVAL